MNIKFEKEYLSELYYDGKCSDKKHRFQPQVIRGYLKCVIALEEAKRVEDLFRFNALNYERLSGDKNGLSSLRINNQYRFEFREIVNSENEPMITVCSLVDITNHYK